MKPLTVQQLSQLFIDLPKNQTVEDNGTEMPIKLLNRNSDSINQKMITKQSFVLTGFFAFALSPHLALVALADTYRMTREHVLGTSMEWIVNADNQKEADRSERIALDEIERLDAILSRYRTDSSLSLWTAGHLKTEALPNDLKVVLHFAEKLRLESVGAFDVRVTRLEKLWNQAVEAQLAPTLEQRRAIVESFQKAPYHSNNGTISEAQLHERTNDLANLDRSITLDAIAKGYILDCVCDRVLHEMPNIAGICINIGGDLRQVGKIDVSLQIENPFASHIDSAFIQTWTSQSPTAMATSGGYRRSQKLKDMRISHLLDPRTGLPCDSVASVSAIAATGMEADGYATVVSVLGTVAGLAWIESRPGSACMIVDANGQIHRSSRWPKHESDRETSNGVEARKYIHVVENNQKPGLHVDFTLAKVGGGAYRRPYVAVWLEDEESFPVKTAVLWMQTDQPGPRWHRDLTRWYRNDRIRKLAEKSELIGTASGATRGPGEYEAYFDGTDNTGKPLKPGKYTLYLEAARENGTYQITKQAIEWGSKPIAAIDLKGNVEMEKATLRYVPLATQ